MKMAGKYGGSRLQPSQINKWQTVRLRSVAGRSHGERGDHKVGGSRTRADTLVGRGPETCTHLFSHGEVAFTAKYLFNHADRLLGGGAHDISHVIDRLNGFAPSVPP
jgi:hypothetical protein